MEDIKNWIVVFFNKKGVSEGLSPYLTFLILFLLVLAVSVIAVYTTRVILRNTVTKILEKQKSNIGAALAKYKIRHAFSLLVAVIIFKIANPILFEDAPGVFSFLEKLIDLYFLYVIIRILIVVLKAIEDSLSTSDFFVEKPIASYFQLSRILLIIIAIILGLSILMGKSPLYFLGAFGAMTAILMLIFKDTILGLVASVQISSNDMLRIGDWIEMPKFNTDGDVIAINLNTVKIRNFDKTISTVPTYYFVTESFKNYRGMQESGGRRIKRTLRISVTSIKFIDKKLKNKLLQFDLIRDYVLHKDQEITEHNTQNSINTDVLINGRRMTNIGTFRIYIQKYLESHPGVHQGMNIMARQQTPDEFGVPIEIYCFANSTVWVEYENIQSDIFDHLLAAADAFDLEVFQKPTGKDFSRNRNE